MAVMNSLAPRRERLRAATIAEIKQAAREQAAAGGVGAISLRGIAKTIGMAPSALYRYFDSHDVLVSELCADAFASLADALEASYHGGAGIDPARRWLLLARAYRRWAHEHLTEYTLLFGPRAALDHVDKSGRCGAEMHRAVGVLFLCMITHIEAGVIEPSHLDARLNPRLREELAAWGVEEGAPISVAALAGCLLVWTQLHGFLTLELFGHLPPTVDTADLYDQQMLEVIVHIGYREPIDLAAVTAPSADATGADATGAVAPAVR
jgi:AcrR family transcriptional regulator